MLISPRAWAEIGTLSEADFRELRQSLDDLSWSAAQLRERGVAVNRTAVCTEELFAVCELDHPARRVTVLSLGRGTPQDAPAKETG